MKNILVAVLIIFFVSSIAYSASTPLKKSGSKFSDQRQGSDPTRNFSGDNSPQMKSPGTKYSDQNKQSDPTRNTGDNNTPLKDPGQKFSDTRAGIVVSTDQDISGSDKETGLSNKNNKINIDISSAMLPTAYRDGTIIQEKEVEKVKPFTLYGSKENRKKMKKIVKDIQILLKLIDWPNKKNPIKSYPVSDGKEFVPYRKMNIGGLHDYITTLVLKSFSENYHLLEYADKKYFWVETEQGGYHSGFNPSERFRYALIQIINDVGVTDCTFLVDMSLCNEKNKGF